MNTARKLTALTSLAILCVFAATDEAEAQVDPLLGEVRLAMTRDGRTDRFGSNQQLKLAIGGRGTCEIDIELHEAGRGRLVSTRRVRAALPMRYVSDYGLPALGRPGDVREYMLKVSPKPSHALAGGGCSGRTSLHHISVINRGVVAAKEPSTPLHIRLVPGLVPGRGAAPAGSASGGNNSNGNNSNGNNSNGNGSGGNGSSGGPAPAPTDILPDNPPASTGALNTLQVPGGSMQEGAGQQLQLDGSGVCGFDLRIQRTDGNAYDQTFSVSPRPLPTTAINGLEFPMLAQGSYKATAIGKGGCSGAPTIHFKVQPPPVVQKDPNAPSFKRPTQGQVRKPSDPDGTNVWIELDVPSNLKNSDMSTACCELEFNYKDATGAWTPNVASGPTAYPELKTTATFRSISYFSQGLQWRVRARGYKFQTEFPWSEWVEFTVHQK